MEIPEAIHVSINQAGVIYHWDLLSWLGLGNCHPQSHHHASLADLLCDVSLSSSKVTPWRADESHTNEALEWSGCDYHRSCYHGQPIATKHHIAHVDLGDGASRIESRQIQGQRGLSHN